MDKECANSKKARFQGRKFHGFKRNFVSKFISKAEFSRHKGGKFKSQFTSKLTKNSHTKENSQKNSTNSKAISMNLHTTSQENSQGIYSLLDDLEAKFGLLLAVRNLTVLSKAF